MRLGGSHVVMLEDAISGSTAGADSAQCDALCLEYGLYTLEEFMKTHQLGLMQLVNIFHQVRLVQQEVSQYIIDE